MLTGRARRRRAASRSGHALRHLARRPAARQACRHDPGFFADGEIGRCRERGSGIAMHGTTPLVQRERSERASIWQGEQKGEPSRQKEMYVFFFICPRRRRAPALRQGAPSLDPTHSCRLLRRHAAIDGATLTVRPPPRWTFIMGLWSFYRTPGLLSRFSVSLSRAPQSYGGGTCLYPPPQSFHHSKPPRRSLLNTSTKRPNRHSTTFPFY